MVIIDGVTVKSCAFAVTMGPGYVEKKNLDDPDYRPGRFADGSTVKNVHAIFGTSAAISLKGLANVPKEYLKELRFDKNDRVLKRVRSPSIGVVRDRTGDSWKPIVKGSRPSQEFLELWWNRTTDIIEQYQPDLLWFDFGLDKPGFEPMHKKILAYYYNKGLEWSKEVVFQDKNMKNESFPEDLIVLDIERGRMDKINKYPWQTAPSLTRTEKS